MKEKGELALGSVLGSLPRLDLHVHTAVSDGEGRLEDVVARARARGLDVVAVTDHYDPLDPTYAEAAPACLEGILAARGRLGEADATAPGTGRAISHPGTLRVLVGLERGPRPLPEPPAGLFPVIGSVHYLPDPYRPARRDLFDARYWRLYQEAALHLTGDPQLHILGHLAGYLPLDPLLPPVSTFAARRAWEQEIVARFFTPAWYEAVFRRAAAAGVAIELHCATRTPDPDVVRLGLKLGVKFSVGSDAHSLDRVGDVGWAQDLLESLGATPRDLLALPA